MSMAVSANRLEILQIADAVAREKSIDRTIESLLKDFRVDCVRLPAWSRDSWIEQVMASLPLGPEQLGLF